MMKIVISDPSTGKTYQVDLDKSKEAMIVGKKIGDEISGDLVGAAGYTLVLTGGSDGSGFPMRNDVPGPVKKKILTASGPGFHPSRKGERKRVLVRGNVYSSDIVQVNAKVVKSGSVSLDELFAGGEKQDAS